MSAEEIEASRPFSDLAGELRCALSDYWRFAEQVLNPCGVFLRPLSDEDLSVKQNFFSLLFLYSFYRVGMDKARRIIYATMLQCLRGMVTGCDNLLDDEYKKTLDTDLPESGVRFRSVVDIMVSDRVLFLLFHAAHRQGNLSSDQVATAVTVSMQTLARSGSQEASEEAGIARFLPPDELLQTVHHYKTGILFQSPWDIPLAIETIERSAVEPLLKGLYRLGLGCQMMDDMVDFISDISRKRHNYLVSLIYHESSNVERSRLQKLLDAETPQNAAVDLPTDFPEALSKASHACQHLLKSGLVSLFPEEHRFLVSPSIRFLRKRIGADHLMPDTDQNRAHDD